MTKERKLGKAKREKKQRLSTIDRSLFGPGAEKIPEISRHKAMEDAVRDLLLAMGEDPHRPGLVDTPARVSNAWLECWGLRYTKPGTDDLLTLFTEDKLVNTQMVTVRDLVFHSHCEHHMAPFFGKAHISYIPTTKGVVGLSKFARVINHFASSLQVQERLTNEIADFLTKELSRNVAVMLEATHMCMVSRGVLQPNAVTVTSALRGEFFVNESTRSEFYRAIGR